MEDSLALNALLGGTHFMSRYYLGIYIWRREREREREKRGGKGVVLSCLDYLPTHSGTTRAAPKEIPRYAKRAASQPIIPHL